MREFLDGTYVAELNRDNPLGKGGKLAEAFGGLMEKLWQVQILLECNQEHRQGFCPIRCVQMGQDAGA